jgi:hypothetical protein
MKGLAALCVLAFAQPLCAAPADDLKALIEKGDARGAYELGRKHPAELGNPAFDFYFGVAAIDSGHAGEGVLALERYIANFPDNIQARLELARGYFVLGEDARAREEFNRVLNANPPPDVVANIDRFLDALRARESAYKTTAGAFVEFGLGYDSNVNGGVKNPALIAPGVAGLGERHSNFAQASAGASVVHPVAPGVALFGSVAGDFRVHDRAENFDQRSLGVTGGASLLREKDLFRASASFSTLDLDYSHFRNTWSLTGEWTHQLDELQAVNGYLQWADLDYGGINEPRDSHLYGLGAGYRRAFIGPWQPLLTANASYGREDNRGGANFLTRDIWGARVAVAVTPAPRWAVSAGATYYYSDYVDDVTSGRRDNYYALDLSAGYAVTRNLSVRGELLLSKNDSNVAFFEYRRDVVAVKVRYEFK